MELAAHVGGSVLRGVLGWHAQVRQGGPPCLALQAGHGFLHRNLRRHQRPADNNNTNDNYTFPVRRLGVHLDHLKITR
jgi:hypothetical protein